MKKMISVIFLLALSSTSFNAFSGQDKVEVCHKGQEISVASPALGAHRAHGDTVGSCDEYESEQAEAAVVMMRCDAIAGNGVEILSFSSSLEDEATIDKYVSGNCAEAMAYLINDGFKLRSVKSGTAEAEVDGKELLQLYADYLMIRPGS